jgi:hypothetical protein
MTELAELETKMASLVRRLAKMVCEAVAVIDRGKKAQPRLSTAPEGELDGVGHVLGVLVSVVVGV